MPRPLVAALTALLALTVAACDFEQVIELEAPAYTPRLVIGAFPAADSLFEMRVGRSVSAFEPGTFYSDEQVVRDAAVVLLDESGAVLDHLDYVPDPDRPEFEGVYRARNGTVPRSGQTYSLAVSASGYPDAQATTRVPERVPFEAEAVLVQEDRFHGGRAVDVTIRLDDPPGANTYEIEVVQLIPLDRPEGGAPDTLARKTWFESVDPSLREDYASLGRAVDLDLDADPRRIYAAALLRDDAFDGEVRTVRLRAPDTFSVDRGGERPDVVIVVTSIDADYVRYQQTLALQRENGENPFAEPVRIHTNVEGGLGVFSGSALYRLRVPVVEG